MDVKYQNCNIELKFLGENEVPAKLYCDVLANIIAATEEVKSTEIDNYEINIKATKPGSFITDLAIQASVVWNLITETQMINFALEGIKLVTEYLKLKVFLKGDKPKNVTEKEGKIMVENNYGDITYISNQFYDNSSIGSQKLDYCSSVIGDGLSKSQIPGVQILNKDDNTNLLDLKKENYKYLKAPLYESVETLHTQIIDCYVRIKKADFTGCKWQFEYKKTINAIIEDEQWLSDVNDGNISIHGRTNVKVRMKIEQILDNNNRVVDNSEKYYILKVLEVEKYQQTEQTKMY